MPTCSSLATLPNLLTRASQPLFPVLRSFFCALSRAPPASAARPFYGAEAEWGRGARRCHRVTRVRSGVFCRREDLGRRMPEARGGRDGGRFLQRREAVARPPIHEMPDDEQLRVGLAHQLEVPARCPEG